MTKGGKIYDISQGTMKKERKNGVDRFTFRQCVSHASHRMEERDKIILSRVLRDYKNVKQTEREFRNENKRIRRTASVRREMTQRTKSRH